MTRALLALLAAALIAAATFPWDLQDHPHWYKVAWTPFASGVVRPHDLLLNAALYFPLGWFAPGWSIPRRMLAAAALALPLSAALETAQVWSHVRFPSATDVAMNLAGALVGAAWAARRARAAATARAPASS